MSQRLGLGTVVIIPERPITKRDIPNQHAHQSSVFMRAINIVFREMFVTYTTNILIAIYYLLAYLFQMCARAAQIPKINLLLFLANYLGFSLRGQQIAGRTRI